jgi:hypothetical protein
MLEYAKIILSKTSFDKKLFEKEYKKAIRVLDTDERADLENWVRDKRSVLTD